MNEFYECVSEGNRLPWEKLMAFSFHLPGL